MSIELNPGQDLVATTLDGKVLVSAGAGTGKTRALTERFVRAVTSVGPGRRPTQVDEILTITFTEKAAGEIAERIRAELRRRGLKAEADGLEGAWISTIHGLGRRLLRRHALEAGIDPAFTVADDVIEGFLSDEALEAVLKAGIAECSQVRHFVEAYGVIEAARAVRTVARELRARGLQPEALLIEQPAQAEGLHSRALHVMERASAGFAPHAGGSTGAAKNHEACEAAIGLLCEAPALRGQDSVAVARKVWDTIACAWPPRARAAAVTEVAGDLAEARREIAGEAAQVLVQPLLIGLKEAVSRYIDERDRLKEERGILDFDDLQERARFLVQERPGVAERYRRRFKLVMVDEFQDTDQVQLELIEAISENNLCTVGDERQSIYGFRGADIDVYRRHRDRMLREGAASAELVENYRSHPEIIAFVNRLFESDALFGQGLPALVASRPEVVRTPEPGARVTLDLVRAGKEPLALTDRSEAEALAERFDQLRTAGFAPGEMVVLVRAYRKATPIADALRATGFEVEVVGGSRFFGLGEVKALRALCETIANPLDEAALAQLALSDLSALSDQGAASLALFRRERGGPASLWEALGRAEEVLAGCDQQAAYDLRALIEHAIERSATGTLAEAVAFAVEESSLDVLYLTEGERGRQAFANVQKFLDKIESFERSGGAGAAAFATRLRAEEQYGSTESPARAVGTSDSAIRIMSVHAAKGLEFPVVGIPFMAAPRAPASGIVRCGGAEGGLEVALALPKELTEEAAPGFDRTAGFIRLDERARDAEMTEMKRQFYVACTRAREALVLTGTVKGDQAPEEMSDSPLAWSRRALAPLRDLPEEGSHLRSFDGEYALEVSVRGVDAEAPEVPHAPEGASRVGEGVTAELLSGSEAEPAYAGESRDRAGFTGSGAPPVAPRQLSATDVGVFERCSLRYWAERVVRFGEVRTGGPDDPRAFGSALHAYLQADAPGAQGATEELALRILGSHGVGQAALPRLVQAFDTWKGTSTRADLHGCDRVWTEYPFLLQLPAAAGGHFDVAGAIDAWGCKGSHALVVDYKTGTSVESAEALRDHYSVQASVYAFALLSTGYESVDVRFVRPEAVEGGSVQEVRFDFDLPDRARIESALIDVHHRIASEPYRPLERWSRETCSGCRISGNACTLTVLDR